MKKIVSLLALCAVLLGTVMVVTGCGKKPEKGTVWQVEGTKQYYCFHSDGNLYEALKNGNTLMAQKLGPYTIGSKKVTMMGTTFDYKSSGNKMTLTGTIDGQKGAIVLQKSSDYTEKQIKDALGVIPLPHE